MILIKNKNFVKLVYAKGKADGVTARDLLIEISDKSGLPLRRFGKIACYAHCTRIEAPEGNLRQILKAFNNGKEELMKIDDGKAEEEQSERAPRGRRSERKPRQERSERAERTERPPRERAPKRKLRDMFTEWENEANAEPQVSERRKKPRRS